MSDIGVARSFLLQLDINFAVMNTLLLLVMKSGLEGDDGVKLQLEAMVKANGELLTMARNLVAQSVK